MQDECDRRQEELDETRAVIRGLEGEIEDFLARNGATDPAIEKRVDGLVADLEEIARDVARRQSRLESQRQEVSRIQNAPLENLRKGRRADRCLRRHDLSADPVGVARR